MHPHPPKQNNYSYIYITDKTHNADASSSNVVQDWGKVQLNCSSPNALTVNYSKNLNLPDHIKGHITDRSLLNMSLVCRGKVSQITMQVCLSDTINHDFVLIGWRSKCDV